MAHNSPQSEEPATKSLQQLQVAGVVSARKASLEACPALTPLAREKTATRAQMEADHAVQGKIGIFERSPEETQNEAPAMRPRAASAISASSSVASDGPSQGGEGGAAAWSSGSALDDLQKPLEEPAAAPLSQDASAAVPASSPRGSHSESVCSGGAARIMGSALDMQDHVEEPAALPLPRAAPLAAPPRVPRTSGPAPFQQEPDQTFGQEAASCWCTRVCCFLGRGQKEESLPLRQG